MPEYAIQHPKLPTQPRLLHIPGGTFRMGSDDTSEEAKYDGKPAHEATLSDFYLGEFAVTQDLWAAVMGENPSNNQGERLPPRPVPAVTWLALPAFQ